MKRSIKCLECHWWDEDIGCLKIPIEKKEESEDCKYYKKKGSYMISVINENKTHKEKIQLYLLLICITIFSIVTIILPLGYVLGKLVSATTKLEVW